MSTTCPNGHESEWEDYCSTCGEHLGGASPGGTSAGAGSPPVAEAAAAPASSAASATPAAATGPTCENCGVPRQAHDVFCESCGYDFATGSLPETGGDDADANTGRPPTPSIPVHTKISVDRAFFAASVGEDVDLELPDPVPDQHIVPLNGTRILIGRTSQSRGIFPEIDVQALNSDPAVSSRHAMLELDPAGQWTLTDLGSTNGTFLSADAGEPVEAGVALPVAPGTTFFVGAWTRIELAKT